MYEYQPHQAHLLRIDDLHRAADNERRARRAVQGRRRQQQEQETESRVMRLRARWGKAA